MVASASVETLISEDLFPVARQVFEEPSRDAVPPHEGISIVGERYGRRVFDYFSRHPIYSSGRDGSRTLVCVAFHSVVPKGHYYFIDADLWFASRLG